MRVSRRSLLLTGLSAGVLGVTSCVRPMVPTGTSSVSRIEYPAIAAHRGGRLVYPEGSMEAFRAVARKHPHQLLEMDVRPLIDGTLVVCHDDTIDRISLEGKTGRVDTMSPVQWANLIVKNADGTQTAPAAFLSEVLLEFGGTGKVLIIELKDYSDEARRRYIEQVSPYREQVISACFDTLTAKILSSSGFSGLELASTPPAKYLPGISHVALSHKVITSKVISEVHSHGARLWAWTVNNARVHEKLVAMGVDGIITDYPDI